MNTPYTGLFIALFVMTAWAYTLYFCLFVHNLSFLTTPPIFLFLHHLYTGLFITAHDSIHGTLSKESPFLNYWLGKVCLMVFAGFDYDMIREEHWKHHAHAGHMHDDPDFHTGEPGFAWWFTDFMKHYMSLK